MQDPRFDLQFAVPVIDQGPTQAAKEAVPSTYVAPATPTAPAMNITWQVPAAVDQGPKVSVQFHSAKPAEVLEWLEKQGISFVVADGMIPPNSTFTINMVDQPVGNIADALARALGGHWENQNNIRIYKAGSADIFTTRSGAIQAFPSFKGDADFAKAFKFDGKPGEPFTIESGDMKGLKLKLEDLSKKRGDAKTWMLDAKGDKELQLRIKEMTEAMPDLSQLKALELSQKDMEKQFGPEFRQKMELRAKEMAKEFGPAYQKKMEAMAKDMQSRFGPEFQKKMELKMSKDFGPAYQQKMESMAKDMQKRFGPEFQKKMELEAKAMAKAGADRDRVYYFRDGKLQKAEIEKMKGRQFKMSKDMPFVWTYDSKHPSDTAFFYDTKNGVHVDSQKFLNSLTPDQKDQMKKKGYLWYIDLSPEQKQMLGSPTGKFELHLKIGDQVAVVKRT